jgi:type III secretion protein T
LEEIAQPGVAVLLGLGREALTALLLSAARMVGILLVLPAFSRNLIPGLVRTGIAFGLVALLVPTVFLDPALPSLGLFELAALLIKETAVGTFIGLAFSIPFFGVEAAGFFIDNHRGAAIAGSLDPLSGSESSPLGILFLQVYTAYFFTTGGFLLMLGVVYDSYALWPVLSFWPELPPEIVDFALGLLDKVVRLAVLLAGPIIIVMFLAELGLALISRFAPQLNVFVLAMPVKSGVGLFLLALYVPFLMHYEKALLAEFVPTFDGLRALLR